MKLKNFLFLLIPLMIISCTYSDISDASEWFTTKVENHIVYIYKKVEYKPSRVLKNLKDAALEALKLDEENADPENLVVTSSPVNRMSLVFIPAGDFIMGSTSHYDDEEPVHSVYLDSYWIAKTQITNAQFAKCVKEGVCTYSVSLKRNPRYTDPNYADHPVVYISWYQAQTYCLWSGGKLPTEAEWEKAARGPYGDEYAWGSEEPSKDIYLTNAHNKITDTTPVGLFVKGASYYGVMDMGGNVREWVSDWYDPTYYLHSPQNNPKGPETGDTKVLKGASYLDPYDYSRAASRLDHKPSSPGATRGFRCVYTNVITEHVHFILNN